MKKLLLLMLLAGSFAIVQAQTAKGTWMMGLHNFSPGPVISDGQGYNLFPQTNALGISFGSIKEKIDGELTDDKQTNSQIGLSLNSLYFVADQFAIGLVGNFSTSSSNYESGFGDDYKSSSTLLLIGPEARYYFDAGTKTKIWIKGGAGFGSIASKYDGESSDPISLSQFGGGAGLSIFPFSTVSIDVGMGYNVLTLSEKDSDYKNISSGLAMDVGFGIFF